MEDKGETIMSEYNSCLFLSSTESGVTCILLHWAMVIRRWWQRYNWYLEQLLPQMPPPTLWVVGEDPELNQQKHLVTFQEQGFVRLLLSKPAVRYACKQEGTSQWHHYNSAPACEATAPVSPNGDSKCQTVKNVVLEPSEALTTQKHTSISWPRTSQAWGQGMSHTTLQCTLLPTRLCTVSANFSQDPEIKIVQLLKHKGDGMQPSVHGNPPG